MPLDTQRLRAIAHSLASQSATLELESFVLESLGDAAAETCANVRRVATTLSSLVEQLEAMDPR